MTVFEFFTALLARVATLFASPTPRTAILQAEPMRNRCEVADGVWNAFWVIGQGGPIERTEPSSFRD